MKMNRFLRLALPILVIVVGIVLMKVLIGLRREPPRRSPTPRSVVVETERVAFGTLSSDIDAYGRAASGQPVTLVAEVGGRLESGDVPFRAGETFAAGDLLLRVDDRQIRLQIESQKSDLLAALARVLPEIELDFPDAYGEWAAYFADCDFGKALAPLPETRSDQLKLYLARYNVYKLWFAIRELEIKLEKHAIRAPFSGTVVSVALREGGTVNVGGQLGAIVNLSDMEIELAVAVEDIARLDRSAPARLSAAGERGETTGRIVRVGSTVDTATQTVPVFVRLDAAANVLEGSFFTATLPGIPIDGVYRLPRKAIYGDDTVYIIEAGKLAARRIDVLLYEDETALIDGGLAEGDELVVEIMQGVAEGMPAAPRGAAAGAPGAGRGGNRK